MKRKPNPFIHMLVWGMSSGFVLAMAYIIIILKLSDSSGVNLSLLDLLLNPVLWQLSLFFGALQGGILGLAAAVNLWLIMRKVALPISEGKIRQLYPEIYATTMALTAVLTFMLIAALFSTMSLFFLIPPFVAPIVAAYAAHRYTSHVVSWSQSSDSRKSKITSEMREPSRLQDRFADERATDDMIERRQSLAEKSSS